ncbi:hypothetical protein [Asanoa siamensis]|uniref:Uncharacterized protein n=1 Tax=Asanoa siamensis TaxID=926357 RepID=A0ABQ4CVN4_9ACTN|nr:hypothetical protein [Asanoa siamensis]GIF75356.1 hypothetical protein Asi02nite_48740 [Asanoa siamensis]
MTDPDERDPEANEADASEQATPAVPDDPRDDAVRVGPEVPEADAVEQSRSVRPDDDYR